MAAERIIDRINNSKDDGTFILPKDFPIIARGLKKAWRKHPEAVLEGMGIAVFYTGIVVMFTPIVVGAEAMKATCRTLGQISTRIFGPDETFPYHNGWL